MSTEELTQAERDEDAFNVWNRDITDYVPSLFDAYLFGLNRARSENAKLRELADRLAAELRLHRVSCEALHEHTKLS